MKTEQYEYLALCPNELLAETRTKWREWVKQLRTFKTRTGNIPGEDGTILKARLDEAGDLVLIIIRDEKTGVDLKRHAILNVSQL